MTEPTNNLPAVRSNPGRLALYPDSPDDARLEAILEAIRSGTIGFEAECAAQGFKPATVRVWALRDTPEGFKAAYREARRVEMEMFGDELVSIADSTGTTAGEVYRGQLAIRTRQWLMERRAAMEFGNRGVVDESGKQVPVQQIIVGNQVITF